MRNHLLPIFVLFIGLCATAASCSDDAPPMGEAITNRDSLPVMLTRACSKLISDSGVVRYKIVAEEWKVFDRTHPPRMEFTKGFFLERYDNRFLPDLIITADTAYCYNQNLWELRGRVNVRNKVTGMHFHSEEIFWNQEKHLIYGNQYIFAEEPGSQIEGDSFTSNEQMTQYEIKQSRGFMPSKNLRRGPGAQQAPADTTHRAAVQAPADSAKKTPEPQRPKP